MTSTESQTTFARILAELSDPFTEDRDHVTNPHNPYHLATLADCYSPDRSDSPGAEFLARIARDVADHCNQYAGTPDDGDDWPLIIGELTDGDAAHEIADAAVPIYTHERWATFVDLGAYNEEVSDLAPNAAEDMTGAAGVALYIIADRLVRALAEELSEALDDDDDQSQIDQETDLRDSDAYNA